jgi:hypothetical protein
MDVAERALWAAENIRRGEELRRAGIRVPWLADRRAPWTKRLAELMGRRFSPGELDDA